LFIRNPLLKALIFMNAKKFMNSPHFQRIFSVFALLSVFVLFLSVPTTAEAQAGTAAEVLAEINGVRAANGMAPLVENIYLNIAAQNHANWIAETGIGSHIGEDGSTAADRALAVGYGEGASVWVTENWARGPGLTSYGCVYNMWVPSTDHINNILTTWHNEFGAGVALDSSGFTVYVAVFGHTSGSIVQQPTITPGGPTLTPVPYIQPVTTATPNPDGSVIHIVQPGQSLWAIADAYEIAMDDLLALNGLTLEDAIFPDQELLIVPASVEETVQPTETPDAQENTPTLTPTHEPTNTPQAIQETITPTPTVEKRGSFLVNIFSGDSLWVGIGLVAVSIFGIALLLFTSSRLK
jgi:uncharacterized protein YkwD